MNKFIEIGCKLVIGISIGFLVLMFIVLAIHSHHELSCEKREVYIAEIGGCGRSLCAVKFTDGTTSEVSRPLIGKRYEICVD